ncbi:hypothetical protein AMS68_003868 [Peltaster fructicola]|uniref:Uncharacterized protein n=1 Tax=Peltaster fructicola TaxID=286661 RepID=A0A6H0XUK4_9PEZI|nr:hypothetical protein AMS68_003868 [Peltaster fructicola]
MADTHLHVLMKNGKTVTVERLLGDVNYDKWLPQFEAVAEQKEYTNLFSGCEKLMACPQQYPSVGGFGSVIQHAGDTRQRTLAKAQYEIDRKEYEAQDRRVIEAILLLYSSLDHNIRHLVKGLSTPKSAMDKVKTHFRWAHNRYLITSDACTRKAKKDSRSMKKSKTNDAEANKNDMQDVQETGPWEDEADVSVVSWGIDVPRHG